jgi:hypothetical protein
MPNLSWPGSSIRHSGESRNPAKKLNPGFRRGDEQVAEPRRTILLPRRECARALRVRRAERRKPMVSVILRQDHGGRLAARHKQRLCDAGPRFRFSGSGRSVSQLLAGSRNGPGRSPGAARVNGLRTRPAGTISSRLTTPREAPSKRTRCRQHKRELERGDKFATCSLPPS